MAVFEVVLTSLFELEPLLVIVIVASCALTFAEILKNDTATIPIETIFCTVNFFVTIN